MKDFTQYILEATMTTSEALKIFGVSEIKSKTELNKLFKQLALKYHPDLQGGSDEMMKQLNAAKEVLSKIGVVRGTSSKNGETEEDKNHKCIRAAKHITSLFDSLDLDAYIKYFNDIFSDSFSVSQKEQTNIDDFSNKRHLGTTNMKLYVKFSNEDKSRTIDITMYTDILSIIAYKMFEKPSLSYKNVPIDLVVITNAVIDGKHQKIQNKTYSSTKDSKLFKEPSEIFPKARMTKIAEGKVRANSKVKKSDFVKLFTVTYNDLLMPYYDDSKTWVIHYGSDGVTDKFIYFSRHTVFKQASYDFSIYSRESGKKFASLNYENQLTNKMRGVLQTKYNGYYDESKETLEFITIILKGISDVRKKDKWISDTQLEELITKANNKVKFDKYIESKLGD